MTVPVRVGLVGAGQWARTMHAPMHSSGTETTLSGVWSPHPERALEIAQEFGVRAFRTFQELVAESEAVDFAVPPGAQAPLAGEAAAAGRALLLEKPLAQTLADAIELVNVIDAAGVVNAVNLTKRYHQRTRDFLSQAQTFSHGVLALTGRYIHGGFLQDGFLGASERQGWRSTLGALYDLGPHLLDLADAAAGRIQAVCTAGDVAEVVSITTTHAGGAVGHFIVSGRIATPHVLTDVDLYAHEGHVTYSTQGFDLGEAASVLRAEFAAAIRFGSKVTVDAHRALDIQRVIDAAARSYEEGAEIQLP